MSERPDRPVENFTRPFLVTGCLAIFVLLVLIWAMAGYGWALGVAGLFWLGLRLTSA